VNWNDAINGSLECVSAGLMLGHCHATWRDKKVSGVNIKSQAAFTLWSAWNLVYYPSLDQWFSALGAVFVLTNNALWLSLLLRYRD
jgi:hypothetical protein